MVTAKDLFIRAARRMPSKTALIFGQSQVTWQEFNENINALANALLTLGLQKGQRISVLLENCLEYMEIHGAAAKAGFILVPLNYSLKGREIGYIINDAESSALIVGKRYVELIRSLAGELQTIRNYISVGQGNEDMVDYHQLLSSSTIEEPDSDISDEDLLYLLYTSGTTGRPKGVMLTHANVIASCTSTVIGYGIDVSSVNLVVTPLYFVGGILLTSYPHFFVGGTNVILEHFDVAKVFETIQQERVTFTFMAPTMIFRLLEHPDRSLYDISTMKTLIYGGAPMPVEKLKKGIELFGNIFAQGYGLTESSGNVAILRKEEHVLKGAERELRRLHSFGKEHTNHEIRVVDKKGSKVKPGEIGEIVISGDVVMKGYWKSPKETSQALINNWLHTGDMATVDEDGYIYIVDRKKDMLISGGVNIYPKEIEDVIYEHPSVLEVAVIGVPDEEWGESVKALIVLKGGKQATEEEIIDLCKTRLASFKKPKSVEIRDTLPKNPSGKIMKHVLREDYWKGLDRKSH